MKMLSTLDVSVLTGPTRVPESPAFTLSRADGSGDLRAYHRMRKDCFVTVQGLFEGSDLDEIDADERTVVLLARDRHGEVVGGVRLGPATAPDLGWWNGSRLVVTAAGSAIRGVGSALVRAACATAEAAGALRFEATVQPQNDLLFQRLGWQQIREVLVQGRPHLLMRYPIDRIARLARATKAGLAPLLEPLRTVRAGLGGAGFVGDDAAPVPGSDLVAACDAILPSMVERTPEWAGWCAVLVNLNDLAAMGATPVGILDSVGARDLSFAQRVMAGVRDAAQAWRVPVLGGHTQFGVPASLSVTALGRTAAPVPGGGGKPGDAISLSIDLGGGWRPGYAAAQWDSTSHRSPEELAELGSLVARTAPHAAKDVSMAGIVGTLGMLAEAGGTGAEVDVAAVPRPARVVMGDWLTCFPGFGMLTADTPGRVVAASPASTAACGVLTATPGVRLRWPDGEVTAAVTGPVSGMGRA